MRNKGQKKGGAETSMLYIYLNIKSSSHPTNTYQILHHLPKESKSRFQAAWDNPNLVSPAHRGLELEPSWLFHRRPLMGPRSYHPFCSGLLCFWGHLCTHLTYHDFQYGFLFCICSVNLWFFCVYSVPWAFMNLCCMGIRFGKSHDVRP